jgi:hypothetical protein
VKSFGNYAICDPITHQLEKEPKWFWKINPPTSGDELAMSKFLVQQRVELGTDGIRRDFPPTNTEICHRELALTFGGTNIPADLDKPVEDGGEPMLKTGANVEAVEAVLRSMPHPMVIELWDALADAVVGWGPARPKALTTSSS